MQSETTTPPADGSSRQRLGADWRLLWIVLTVVASLLACLIVDFAYFPLEPIFTDERRFLDSANLLAATGQFRSSGDLAWEMPGTAIFQAVFFRISSQPLLAIRCAQAILLVGQAILCGYVAYGLFQNRRTAAIAFGACAFYPFFIFFQGTALSEPVFDFLLVAALGVQVLWLRRGLAIDWSFAVCCILYAAATYTKATLTVLPPLLLTATVIAAEGPTRRAVRTLGLATAIYFACLAPWWIRNYNLLGTFVPFTTSAASNLYLGNNPANIHGGADWSKDAGEAEVLRITGIPGEIARQREYSAQALAYMKDHPETVVLNGVRKFLRFWSIIPNAQDFRTPLFAIVSALTYGPMLILALFCALRGSARWPAVAGFYLLFAYFTALHTVTIASLRYRLPLDSLLIILAADPLRRIGERLAKLVTRRT